MLSYPYTFFFLQNLKNFWLCSFTSALLAPPSVLSQTEWLLRITEAAIPTVIALHSWLPQPRVPGQRSLWHSLAGGCGGLPWVTTGRIWPDLQVPTDCNSGGCLILELSVFLLLAKTLPASTGVRHVIQGVGIHIFQDRGFHTSTNHPQGLVLLCSQCLAISRTPVSLSLSSQGGAMCTTQSQPCLNEPHYQLSLCGMLIPSDLSKSCLSQRENPPQIQWVWGWIPDPRQVLLQRSLESRI